MRAKQKRKGAANLEYACVLALILVGVIGVLAGPGGMINMKVNFAYWKAGLMFSANPPQWAKDLAQNFQQSTYDALSPADKQIFDDYNNYKAFNPSAP